MSSDFESRIAADQQRFAESLERRDFDEAATVAQRISDLTASRYGQAHPAYAATLVNRGVAAFAGQHYEQAAGFYSTAADLLRVNAGDDDLGYVFAVEGLAMSCLKLGRDQDAEAAYLQALASRRKRFGADGAEVIPALFALVELYVHRKDFVSAIPLAREALVMTRTARGDQHPDVLQYLDLVAGLQHNAGQRDNALAAMEEAVSWRKRHADPSYVPKLRELAELLRGSGRLHRAGPFYRELATIALADAGPTARTGDLFVGAGAIYYTAGDFVDALPLFEKALEIRRAALGPFHPTVLDTLNSLVGLHQKMQNDAAVAAALEELVDLEAQVLGPTNAEVLQHLGFLAQCHLKSKNYGRAAIRLQQLLEAQRAAGAVDDSQYAQGLSQAAAIFERIGQYASAEPLLEQVLAIAQQQQGERSPEATAVVERLANAYEQTGDYGKAEPMWRRELERSRATPAGSPHTARYLAHLAAVLRSTARYAESEQLYHEALDIHVALDASSSVDQHADALNGLAMLLDELERPVEAEALFRRALELRRSQPSASQSDAAITLVNIASTLESQGKYNDALALLEEARTALKQSVGEDHPVFATVLNNLALLLETLGREQEAGPLLHRALAIERASLGEQHVRVATTLSNLASLHNSRGEHTQAEELYRQALDIQRKRLGPRHPAVAATLNNRARALHDLARYQEAETDYKEALRILGPSDPNLASVQQNLASLYQEIGRYDEAEAVAMQSVALTETVHGKASKRFAASLDRLAQLYEAQGKLTEAGPLYERVLRIRRELLGDSHPLTATSWNNLGNWLGATGHYSRALDDLQKAADIVRQAIGEHDARFALVLSNLANLHRLMGAYVEAERMLDQVLSVRRQLLGADHPDVALTLHNLGAVYQDRGDYVRANRCLEQAIVIEQKTLGPGHPAVALTLSNLGTLQQLLGNFEAALVLYQTALKSQRSALGDNHPLVAVSLNNLAGIYAMAHDYARAASSVQEAAEITRRALGDRHPRLAQELDSLARLEHAVGHSNAALELCREALDIRRERLGEEHPDYAASLATLAELVQADGDHETAVRLAREALERTRHALGDDHVATTQCRTSLAMLCAVTNRLEEAFDLLQQANGAHDRMISQVFAVGSERHRLEFLRRQQHTSDVFLSLVWADQARLTGAVGAAFALVLRRKALGIETTARERKAVRASGNAQTLQVRQRIDLLRRQIARKELDGPGPEGLEPHRKEIAEWKAERDAVERGLAETTSTDSVGLASFLVEPHQIAECLPGDAALVEFTRINLFDLKALRPGGRSPSSPRYLAFVLTSADPSSVAMLDLGDAEVIDRLIDEYRNTIVRETRAPSQRDAEQTEAHPEVTIRSDPPSLRTAIQIVTRHLSGGAGTAAPQRRFTTGSRLRAALFDPVAGAAAGRHRFLLAPDGDLARLPFEALPLDASRFVIDDYRISYVGVGRDLLRFGTPAKGTPGAPLVVASPNFNLQGDTAPRFSAGKPFGPLRGTQLEGEAVATLLDVTPLMEDAGVEGAVKGCRSPLVLHIASHGFFLEGQRAESRPGAPELASFQLAWEHVSALENPLLRSGLALAGANTWLQQGELEANAEDGLLTAEDVTALDLTDTELVVLSACDTGLGEVRAGEGVFGLRRAFVIAGAQTLVMSLWKVPDAQTRTLMELFYQAVIKGESRFEALRTAQRELKQQLMQAGADPDPFFWGAFICDGDPGPLRQRNALNRTN